MWVKYVTRRLAVQVAQAWNYGWGEAMDRVYGVSVKNTLVFRDGKKTEYYVDKVQHKKYLAGLYRLLEDTTFLRRFHGDARKTLESILKRTKRTCDQDLSRLSNRQLIDLYKKQILPDVTQFYVRMWTVFNIGEPLANKARECLQPYARNTDELTRLLLAFSSPLQPNDVLRERMDLLRLALRRKQLASLQFTKELEKHTKKYQHIPMFDFDHQPYTTSHFLTELENMRHPEIKLRELHKSFLNRQKEFARTLKKLRPDQHLKMLLYFLKDSVFLRDYRDMLRQKLNLSLRIFYVEVARRLHITLEGVSTLINKEIIDYLSAGKYFSRAEAIRRKKSFLLIQKNSRVEIYSGVHATRVFRRQVGFRVGPRVKQLQGIIGASGKARGRVVVVFTNKDLKKVRVGDVLVTAMTRQDFLPAIRKAVALVTDEGSITAHVAIIARELHKPCIVGTKVATQVFKDGDIVEVDANKGTVKLLK